MNKIWEKQDYETEVSYRHFQKYYLLQPAPRSLTKAYRKFQIERGVKTPDQIKGLYASGSWQNWFSGKDNKGKKRPESYTWKERATAYDESIFLIKEGDYKEARQQLLKKETVDVDKQLGLWDELSTSFSMFIKSAASKVEEDEVLNPTPYISKAKEIWKWREEIAIFHRRTLDMPAIIKDKPLATEDNKNTMTIDWDEPLKEHDNVGIGEDELIGKDTKQ